MEPWQIAKYGRPIIIPTMTLAMVSAAQNATARVAASGTRQIHTETAAGAAVCVRIADTNGQHSSRDLPITPATKRSKLLYIALPTLIELFSLTILLDFPNCFSMSTDRAEKIEDMLDDPASVSSDAGNVTNRSIPDAIALDKHLAGKEGVTAKTKYMGIRVGRFTAPEHY